jgi:transposase
MAGRTTILPEVKDRILEALRSGNYAADACGYAGVSTSAFFDWVQRGQIETARREAGEDPIESETIYAEFSDAVRTAKAQARVRNVALIQRAAQDTWQAAAWFLERTSPQEWGRFNRTEISGPNGGAVQVESASPVELEDKIRAILAQRGTADTAEGGDAPADAGAEGE